MGAIIAGSGVGRALQARAQDREGSGKTEVQAGR